MNYILVDPPEIEKFYPFTLTRPLGEMRVFGGTIKELWENFLDSKVSFYTQDHLSELYPLILSENRDNVFIPSWLYPNGFGSSSVKTMTNPPSFLSPNSKWETMCRENIGTFRKEFFCWQQLSSNGVAGIDFATLFYRDSYDFDVGAGSPKQLNTHPLVFLDNIREKSSFLHGPYSKLKSNIDCSNNTFFNDDDGPIIIEENVTIMEGAMIRGPVHICKGSTIKMGAKIYGPTVIGPYCKIGGEVSNCIFLGYSNKAHEGFLGHSIIGEWCNIGAGTSNSNLKNDYGNVKMWDYSEKKFKDSGNQFLGLYMGDHSKCAINTSFNTGTTVGVNCNIFSSGFPRNFIPSFSWGGAQGVKPYNFEKAISVAEIVMNRRGVDLTEEYIKMLRSVHDITSKMK